MFEGEYCIIRTINAGVHCGTVVSVTLSASSATVVLENATRLYRWNKHPDGTLSLSGVSRNGAHANSRIDGVVEKIAVMGVIEILPCTDVARQFLSVPRNNK